ncbi:MAG: hypothetical protein ACYTFI_23280 [Planctomycetota bacterium]|jgi:hypothetical protein
MEKVAYAGWENCYRLANGTVELIVTADVGPRIIRFGFEGGENEFKEFDEMLGKTGGDEWLIYGGHRLWHAPEEKPRTYFPDNVPVEVEETDGVVRVRPPVETTTGMAKEIDIRLDPDSARVELTHRLTNTSLWAVELAPWALSVMAEGGRAVIPLPPRGSHEENLLPANSMTMWAYTDMADARWRWGRKYVMLAQDPAATVPQKVGLMVPDGWAAYANGGRLFVKRFPFDARATYPDMGCNVETFTNADFLELGRR